jgi:hypothetical protein
LRVYADHGSPVLKIASLLPLTILRSIDLAIQNYPEPVFGGYNPFDPSKSSVQAFRIATYLELVFGLSALFAASLWLCLVIITESEPSVRRSSSGYPWYWISLHCKFRFHRRKQWVTDNGSGTGNISLLLCLACVVSQISLFGWLNRNWAHAIFTRLA